MTILECGVNSQCIYAWLTDQNGQGYHVLSQQPEVQQKLPYLAHELVGTN